MKSHLNLSPKDRKIVLTVFSKSNDLKDFVILFEEMNLNPKYYDFCNDCLEYSRLHKQKNREREKFSSDLKREKLRLKTAISNELTKYKNSKGILKKAVNQ